MRFVTVVLEHGDQPQLLTAARTVGGLLGVRTRPLDVPVGEPEDRVRAVLAAVSAPDVAAGALDAAAPDALCWDVVTEVDVPLLVLPRRCDRTLHQVSRVLLPMDGAPETALAVTDVARRAVGCGAEVVAMHVFDPDTVPAFWDQAAYSGEQFRAEFLQRHLPDAVRLDLRRGRAAAQVLRECDDTGVDLVVIAWRQDLGEGRASAVRRAIDHGRTPVLLVPVTDAEPSGPADAPDAATGTASTAAPPGPGARTGGGAR